MKDFDEIIKAALQEEVDPTVRSDFSQNVLKTIRKKQRRDQRYFFVRLTLLSTALMAVGVTVLLKFYPTIASSITSSSIAAFFTVSALIVVVQVLDQRLIKEKIVVPDSN